MQHTEITQVLSRLQAGEAGADVLMPLVYDDLHGVAARAMWRERANHTLGPTALVHEAYLRVVGQTRVDWKGRAHFLAVCAEAIHRVLVDHARKHGTRKRAGGKLRVSLGSAASEMVDGSPVLDHLALAEVLRQLERLSERQANVVKLRFYGGLKVEEIALLLGVSDRTVKNDWRVARAWLLDTLD